jgi:hypothetical protein
MRIGEIHDKLHENQKCSPEAVDFDYADTFQFSTTGFGTATFEAWEGAARESRRVQVCIGGLVDCRIRLDSFSMRSTAFLV